MALADYQPLITAGATFFAALVAAGVAITVGVGQLRIARAQKEIADQQRRIADDKLRLDLFDRRIAIFEQFSEVEARLMQFSADHESRRAMLDFSKLLPRAAFLFPEDVNAHFHDLIRLLVRLQSADARASRRDISDEERSRVADTAFAITEELMAKSSTTASVVRRFLSFGHVARPDT